MKPVGLGAKRVRISGIKDQRSGISGVDACRSVRARHRSAASRTDSERECDSTDPASAFGPAAFVAARSCAFRFRKTNALSDPCHLIPDA
jgi:hypothetical protein